MASVFMALAQSRKAWVVLAAVVGVIVMNVTGRVPGERALDFIKWIVMTWLGAQAAEDAAGKLLVPPKSGGDETGGVE